VTFYRNIEKDLLQYFTQEESQVYCTDIPNVINMLGIEYKRVKGVSSVIQAREICKLWYHVMVTVLLQSQLPLQFILRKCTEILSSS
jgi:hypothetical protein